MRLKQVHRRILGLLLAILATGAGIAVLSVKSHRRMQGISARLKQIDSESFKTSDQFGDYLRQLNDLLYHYGRSHVAPDTNEFSRATTALSRWVLAQRDAPSTEEERSMMPRIESALEAYLASCGKLMSRLMEIGEESASMDEYNVVRDESQKLFRLVRDLSRAHLAARDEVLSQATQEALRLRQLTIISLALLLLFATATAIVAYRELILPLRIQLVESEALRSRQEKLASLGFLAAGVAHEIRNPLTAIKAALYIQHKRLKPGTQEFADAQMVDREILRLEKITNDFLHFARPNPPVPSLLSVQGLLQECVRLLQPQLTRLEIQLAIVEGPDAEFQADAAQIKQVLINLIQNSADAIGKGGRVELSARRTRSRLHGAEKEAVLLQVHDNGKGIPPEVQKRLFDPFFTTKDTGTGLGLSICAGIIHRHGGLLQYQTEVGAGTTFGVMLPLEQPIRSLEESLSQTQGYEVGVAPFPPVVPVNDPMEA